MTREKNILSTLNLYEKRFRKAIEEGNKEKMMRYESIIEGMTEMLGMLGYELEVDEDEFVEGYWIYKYGAIEDKRG